MSRPSRTPGNGSVDWRNAPAREWPYHSLRSRNLRIEMRDVARELGWEWRFECQLTAGQWMNELNSVRVQEHSFQALLDERPVPGEIAVFVVAGQRKIEM